ncbi:hypothetical protein ABT297_25140 [Dactylosporangium sp. NPDC000555]|uniref:hypothetical protein n=1 Tax=Dactylosporangium sp. NPDC000555 TaxID=3154260 RepID=UPI003330AAEA
MATAILVGMAVVATPVAAQANPTEDVYLPPKPAGAIAYGVMVNGKLTAEPPMPPARVLRPSNGPATVLGSGGGCQDTLNIGSCINKGNNRLRGDFYYNFENGITNWAQLNIVRLSDGAVLGWYSTPLNHLGQDPVQEWVISGSGSARTQVDIYQGCLCPGHLQFVAQSPTYNYP